MSHQPTHTSRPPTLTGLQIIVSGRVQGVGFREFTRRTAIRMNLTGFVRNCPDGTVLAQCYGEKTMLDRLASGLRKGPPYADVYSVVQTDSEYQSSYTSFQIVH